LHFVIKDKLERIASNKSINEKKGKLMRTCKLTGNPMSWYDKYNEYN
jgi:hypothetical protein